MIVEFPRIGPRFGKTRQTYANDRYEYGGKTTAEPRLWDALYSLTKGGIKIKSFQLPQDFIPLKEQMKDVNEKMVPMNINR